VTELGTGNQTLALKHFFEILSRPVVVPHRVADVDDKAASY
jgi:hypothetical protein